MRAIKIQYSKKKKWALDIKSNFLMSVIERKAESRKRFPKSRIVGNESIRKLLTVLTCH